jgi:hypothetical protein
MTAFSDHLSSEYANLAQSAPAGSEVVLRAAGGRGKGLGTRWHHACSGWVRATPLSDFKLTLVSADALPSVEDYLRHFGARVSSTARLGELEDIAEAAGADAVVLFADDYSPEDVRATVRGLSLRLTVIVTTDRAEYESLHGECRSVVIILPRPTWGWVLLEAVRSGVGTTKRRG